MGAQTEFYATLSDLEHGFRAIESTRPLNLIPVGEYATKALPVFSSFFSLPHLGKVHGRRSPDFLVVPNGQQPRLTRVAQVGKKCDFPPKLAITLALLKIRPPGGRIVYHVYQSNNPVSIIFAPGGFFDDKTFIAGKIATMHTTKKSMELYNLFLTKLLSGFSTVHSFKVGPDALLFLQSGGRLTIDAKAAPLLDLILP